VRTACEENAAPLGSQGKLRIGKMVVELVVVAVLVAFVVLGP
jgi:hypothetical protein